MDNSSPLIRTTKGLGFILLAEPACYPQTRQPKDYSRP